MKTRAREAEKVALEVPPDRQVQAIAPSIAAPARRLDESPPEVVAEARKAPVLLPVAWGAMLVSSVLPDVISVEVLHNPPSMPVVTWGRMAALALIMAICLRWQPLRAIWKYPAILLVIAVGQQVMTWLTETAWWHDGLGVLVDPFTRSYFGTQLWKLGGTLATICALFALGFRRRDAFLVRGDLRAPIRPERWMGFPKPEPWTSFGGKWLFFLGAGMIAILSFFGHLDPPALLGALPFLPVVLLLAGLNSFSEEVTYRSAQLAPLVPVLGVRQAWWLTAILFGTMHYYGVPYGLAGVALATFMGWFLGKAMLETRGFFWPWLVHFTQDVLIFFFIAAGSVQPGG